MEESEVLEVSEEMTSVRSLDVPNAPPGSVNRAPSIRSIRSLWATETDVSFDSTMLGPSPSVISVALPELEVERTVSYESSEMRPSEVTISYASSSPRMHVRSAGSSLSTASTASTIRDLAAVRPASSVISDWEDSFMTQTPLQSEQGESERGTVSSVTSYVSVPVFVVFSVACNNDWHPSYRGCHRYSCLFPPPLDQPGDPRPRPAYTPSRPASRTGLP